MIFTGTDYADEEPIDQDEKERQQSMYDELMYDMQREEEG